MMSLRYLVAKTYRSPLLTVRLFTKLTQTCRLQSTSSTKQPQRSLIKRVTFGTVFGATCIFGFYQLNIAYGGPQDPSNLKVTLYRKMPLRSLSRLWGKVNQLDLPVFMRIPVFRIYIWAFGCNIEEAEEEDLKTYRNLGEFFRRTLKPQVRPIDDIHLLTSPSDGTITHFGRVENGVIKQVKGVNFSVEGFIGPVSWKSPFSSSSSSSSLSSSSSQSSSPDSSSMSSSSSLSSSSLREDINNSHNNVNAHIDQNQKILSQLIHPDNVLYHCVIYLAPGDYHRFHSPTDWIVYFRRHFPGELLSVHPGMARWIKGLFNLNERAMYVGLWKHGFFSMTAVGATNVGSIRIYNDHELATNTWKKPDGNNTDKYLPNEQSPGIEVGKGDLFAIVACDLSTILLTVIKEVQSHH
ncbi:phosphatidylserine decarboxylase proenzyme, mitochondrial-like isoform X2 [Octopus vulgaris]|uniref:phosphatidylserine decarboxylase n=1 Tax=Octopus vulgaris TaxID=6645 RepID=A0AA36AXE2_OCTVU|nr:phosphatidylserine decarboxylase proenzyme, mitochondrial-like isoform X2 [Octopus vulgaris]